MTATSWELTSGADGVACVRPSDAADGVSTDLGRLLESSDHRALLATDLHRWPAAETTLVRHRLPVVAALAAPLGGDHLFPTLAADIRIGSDAASLSFRAEDGGPIQDRTIITLLARLVGAGTAGYWLLTRRTVTASEAYGVGLVHELVPSGEVDDAALEAARRVAGGAPLALEYAKEALRRGRRAGLLDAIDIEGDLYSILHTTDDRSEGVLSFLEHRDPTFRGR